MDVTALGGRARGLRRLPRVGLNDRFCASWAARSGHVAELSVTSSNKTVRFTEIRAHVDLDLWHCCVLHV